MLNNIDPKDLKIEVTPSNWTWVYKPDTEVQITYIPTGYSVKCNATRSQHRNKAIALEYIEQYVKGLTENSIKNDVVTNYHLNKIRKVRSKHGN